MYWYYYLNNEKEKNLLAEHSPKEDELVICWQKEKREYTIFENYHAFLTFQEKTDLVERCFYEIMLPNKMRKIYFDIDLEKGAIDGLELIEAIKKAINDELNNAVVILVFTSHTETKLSYHLILPEYSLKDEKAAHNFYQIIKDKIAVKYHPSLDASVYKSTQQFRVLGSHKYGKANIKVFDNQLSTNFYFPKRYEKRAAKFNYLFFLSLVSKVSGCTYLSQYDVKEKKFQIESIGTASEGDLDDILDIFYTQFSYDDFVYHNVVENNGNLIITFRRQRSSYCQACKRTHEHENPFLLVKGVERNIYYYCRRQDKDKERTNGLCIGSLGQYKLPEIDIADVAIIPSQEEEKKEDNWSQLSNKVREKKKSKKAEINFHKVNLSMY